MKNWTGAKMKEIFDSSADTSTSQVVIGKRKYELRGLEYREIKPLKSEKSGMKKGKKPW